MRHTTPRSQLFRTLSGGVLAVLLTVVGLPVWADEPIAPNPESSNSLAELALFRGELLTLINAERTQRNIPPMSDSPALTCIAQSHTLDMVTHDYFSHYDIRGAAPWERFAEATGAAEWYVGENLAAGQSSAREVLDAWLNSPDHRRLLLEPDMRWAGIGLLKDQVAYQTPLGWIVTLNVSDIAPTLLPDRAAACGCGETDLQLAGVVDS